ncbi:MAG: ribonuclease HI [Bacteroidia bacterium]|nr:ribonuclease HI [Bacteroidia bacterium]
MNFRNEKESGSSLEIYTDGSCHTQLLIGGWAALIFTGKEKIILSGKENNTTHNRMELVAVISAIEYTQKNYPLTKELTVFSDSQYVIGLKAREKKFRASDFTTKKGNEVRNSDLVKKLLRLEETLTIHFIKVKAHQQKTEAINHNIEVDLICRKIVRDAVRVAL